MKRITLALPAPYVGLRPFTEREALLFFGRDAHVRDLLAKLESKQWASQIGAWRGMGRAHNDATMNRPSTQPTGLSRDSLNL